VASSQNMVSRPLSPVLSLIHNFGRAKGDVERHGWYPVSSKQHQLLWLPSLFGWPGNPSIPLTRLGERDECLMHSLGWPSSYPLLWPPSCLIAC